MYLTKRWLPTKKLSLRASTQDGYPRNIELHVVPTIRPVPMRHKRSAVLLIIFGMVPMSSMTLDPIGHDRTEAAAVAARLDNERITGPTPRRGAVTVGEFLTRTWMPHKRRHVRETTAYRYAWFIDRYIKPAIGGIPLRDVAERRAQI